MHVLKGVEASNGGKGGQRKLCHCPSYFPTEGSCDVTAALLAALSM